MSSRVLPAPLAVRQAEIATRLRVNVGEVRGEEDNFYSAYRTLMYRTPPPSHAPSGARFSAIGTTFQILLTAIVEQRSAYSRRHFDGAPGAPRHFDGASATEKSPTYRQ